MNDAPLSTGPLARTAGSAALAAFVALAALLLAAAPASGATYRAAQCNPALGAGHQDASFTRTSAHYASAAGCDEGGGGLAVRHEGRNTASGAWGAWSLKVPAGSELVGVRASVAGASQGGHVPELLVAGPARAPLLVGNARGEVHRLSWAGSGADEVSARLRCGWRGGCGRGSAAHVTVKRLMLTLRDSTAPQLALAGSLLEPGSRRGAEALAPAASDSGSGVRRIVVEVNGDPVAARSLRCALAGEVALRLRPCPERPSVAIAVATGSAPFVQGPNEVRVCAADYAADTSANQLCLKRDVRVDNACPLSDTGGAARLVARFAGSGRQIEVARGESATVRGRLLDGSGAGVAGARACVAVRLPLDGAAETVLATPRSDGDGRFSVVVPAGPSREVRVAHWPGEDGALERMLMLETRADPGLRLLPDRALRNGERVEFVTRLAGPRYAGREARIEVRSDGEWLRLRDGRTNASGVWRSGYRFHSTTRRRSYRFRACVPAQRGYPYVAGCSPTRSQAVVG